MRQLRCKWCGSIVTIEPACLNCVICGHIEETSWSVRSMWLQQRCDAQAQALDSAAAHYATTARPTQNRLRFDPSDPMHCVGTRVVRRGNKHIEAIDPTPRFVYENEKRRDERKAEWQLYAMMMGVRRRPGEVAHA